MLVNELQVGIYRLDSNLSHEHRAPRGKKWNFRTKFLLDFRTISGHFVGFTKLKTQKMHVFLCSQILISQTDQYCSH